MYFIAIDRGIFCVMIGNSYGKIYLYYRRGDFKLG